LVELGCYDFNPTFREQSEKKNTMLTNQLGQGVHLQNIQLPWGITIPGLKGKAAKHV
jgi:hypothetical protein